MKRKDGTKACCAACQLNARERYTRTHPKVERPQEQTTQGDERPDTATGVQVERLVPSYCGRQSGQTASFT